ncbi:hypothetical protein [Octadecabacter sp. SW4]|uniref:hypothetical protein n=1 Tax=Octadecabacter sp. SW4 TaxID=2602067 RepID=UPI00155A178E|nr:hypothetical protein [Octadecabacter sp. SW4]
MTFSQAVLWPGTKVCEKMGLNPEGEAALIRWMVNTLVYLSVALAIVWIVVA